VDNLSFQVREGEIFGLLGPNGAGKTTTIRMLSCIIAPTNGRATVAGFDIAKDPQKIRRSVGILTENPSLYEKLTAIENLEFFAKAYGMRDRQAISSRVKEILEFFQLWDRRNDRAATFSKGMKQKLAIARSIVHDPPVLFLDEPTASLDPESSKLIRDLIERLGKTGRHTVLLCTHRLEDAERLCGRMMIIDKGVCKIIGTMDELRTKSLGMPKLEIRLNGITAKMLELAQKVPNVEGIEIRENPPQLLVTASDVQSATPRVVQALVGEGAMITGVNILLPTLEEIYLKLVKEGKV
jgi:ABC-2 type transport system ATP-binding protein